MYYLYCLCKSVQRSLVSRLLFFSESGCKGKNFKAYLPNIFGSFFLFLSFLFPRRLSCRKGGKKKKKEEPGTVSFKRMSTRAAFIFKSGCKGKNFKAQLPNIFRSFFSFFFSKAEVPEETDGKEEKNGSLPLRFTVRMSKHRRLRSRKRMQK